MRQRPLGRTGTFVSELGLGTLTFGRETPADECGAIVGAYLDAGGNLVDTGDIYGKGESETLVGRAVGARRDEVVLATKVRFRMGPHPNDAGASRRHLVQAVDASLRRLGTDRIDLLHLHAWDPSTALDETLRALDDLVHAGKVLYLGASNYTGWQVGAALGLAQRHGWAPYTTIQPQYSLAVRDAERDVLPAAAAFGLGVLAWAPLGGGVLTGKYGDGSTLPPGSRAGGDDRVGRTARSRLSPEALAAGALVADVATATGLSPAQVALSWLLGRPGITAPIVGVRSLPQLHDALGAAGSDLDEEVRAALDARTAPVLGYPHDVDGTEGSVAVGRVRPPWRE